MPERIQRRRTKDWRMPEGAVYVGRPTKWGNPFRVGDPCTDPLYTNAFITGVPISRNGVVEDRSHAVELFAFWVMATVPFTQTEVLAELGGRDLTCWCPPGPCHADLLLEIANKEKSTDGAPA